jgi:hypothetical protein
LYCFGWFSDIPYTCWVFAPLLGYSPRRLSAGCSSYMTSSFYLAMFVASTALISVIIPSALALVFFVGRDTLSYLLDLREVPSHYCRRDDDQSHNHRDTCTHDPAPSLLPVLLCKPFVPSIMVSTPSCLPANLQDRRTLNQHYCSSSSAIPSPHHPELPPYVPPPRTSSRTVDLSPNLPPEEQQHRELAREVDCGELVAAEKVAEHAGVGLLVSPSCRVSKIVTCCKVMSRSDSSLSSNFHPASDIRPPIDFVVLLLSHNR